MLIWGTLFGLWMNLCHRLGWSWALSINCAGFISRRHCDEHLCSSLAMQPTKSAFRGLVGFSESFPRRLPGLELAFWCRGQARDHRLICSVIPDDSSLRCLLSKKMNRASWILAWPEKGRCMVSRMSGASETVVPSSYHNNIQLLTLMAQFSMT